MSEGLERLAQYVEFKTGQKMPSGIFIDHPVTETRISYLKKELESQKLQRTSFPPGTNIAALDGLVYGQNPDDGIITPQSTFIHSQLGLFIQFPSKWNIHNSPTSVAAIDSAKNGMILISRDTVATSAHAAAEKALGSFKAHKILQRDTALINGNQAYRATVRNKSISSDHVTEIMWIEIGSTGSVLKVVGVSLFSNPNKEIISCLNSFRSLHHDDLKNVFYEVISLKQMNNWQSVQQHANTTQNPDRTLKMLALLNRLIPEQSIPTGQYIKIIETLPVSKR